MDYEEKYKEALERAKEIIECSKSDTKEVRMVLSFFPELKESENICRKLIAFFKQCKSVYGDGFKQFGLDVDDAIAWLEKHGEHANFRNKIQIGDKVTRNEDGVLVNLSQLNRVAKKDEKQVEQKDILENTVLDSNKDGLIADTIRCKIEKQGEQKPTGWSEEDVHKIDRLIMYFKGKDNKEFTDWFSLLKDRVVPQPKQEWSEEDERMLDGIIEASTHHCYLNITDIDWLKSLKDRFAWKPSEDDKEMLVILFEMINYASDHYIHDDKCVNIKSWVQKNIKPYPHWKPSKEQMKALGSAIHCYAGISPTNNREVYALEIMKEQLKKLREK